MRWCATPDVASVTSDDADDRRRNVGGDVIGLEGSARLQ
jgi:hypothetical protein